MRTLDDVIEQVRARYDSRLVLERVLAVHSERAVLVLRDPAGRKLVAKVDEDCQRIALEAGVLASCAGIVPVPRLRWTAVTSPAVILMDHVRGAALANREDESAWRSAGKALRGLHEVAPPGALLSLGAQAFLDVWMDRQKRAASELDVLKGDVLCRALERLSSAAPSAGARDVMIQGDASAQHFLIDPGGHEVVAMLDFGNALLGDPAFDIVSLTLRQPHQLSAVLSGYHPTDALRRRLSAAVALYRLLILISRLTFLLRCRLEHEPVMHLIELELRAPGE